MKLYGLPLVLAFMCGALVGFDVDNQTDKMITCLAFWSVAHGAGMCSVGESSVGVFPNQSGNIGSIDIFKSSAKVYFTIQLGNDTVYSKFFKAEDFEDTPLKLKLNNESDHVVVEQS